MNPIVQAAALDRRPIQGLTHRFYRYPARFSPVFARACIEAYSRPGDVVLDPYMGGGTSVIEARVLGRRAIGSDINSLSVFVSRVKNTALDAAEQRAIADWATQTVPRLKCHMIVRSTGAAERIPRNLTLPSTRWLRKTIALCLASAEELPTVKSERFARCVLLNAGQWALNGRRPIPTACELRERVANTALEMLAGARELRRAIDDSPHTLYVPLLREIDAERLSLDPAIQRVVPVDLVVTSPPYPGIHMLYHRWQVDGRKETDAPYWIAACMDGAGASHYNFADRKIAAEDSYFDKAERSFGAIHSIMRPGAVLVQMVAFSSPRRQLPRYLRMLERAGFHEKRILGTHRLWRSVPRRQWHANLKGRVAASRELVLTHLAT